MQLTTKEGTSRTDTIAFLLLMMAVVLSAVAFVVGRADAATRTAVLLSVTSLVTALSSIAATLLVGKPATTHQVETKEAVKLTTAESQTTQVQPVAAHDDEEDK